MPEEDIEGITVIQSPEDLENLDVEVTGGIIAPARNFDGVYREFYIKTTYRSGKTEKKGQIKGSFETGRYLSPETKKRLEKEGRGDLTRSDLVVENIQKRAKKELDKLKEKLLKEHEEQGELKLNLPCIARRFLGGNKEIDRAKVEISHPKELEQMLVDVDWEGQEYPPEDIGRFNVLVNYQDRIGVCEVYDGRIGEPTPKEVRGKVEDAFQEKKSSLGDKLKVESPIEPDLYAIAGYCGSEAKRSFIYGSE